MNEIDQLILNIGKLVALEFATKPVETALATTRMARKQLHEAEEFKAHYEARMRELTPVPFLSRPIVGFSKINPPQTDKEALVAALSGDGIGTVDWPFPLPAPQGWNRASDGERGKMILEYGLDDPLLDPSKTDEEAVDAALREEGLDPEKVAKDGKEFVRELFASPSGRSVRDAKKGDG